MSNKIHEKISALLKKTEQNGASEAEANAAMSFAQKLMDEYGVKLSDLKDNSTTSHDFGMAKSSSMYKVATVDQHLSGTIGWFTDTKCIAVIVPSQKHEAVGKHRKTTTITFFGFKVDVELAMFLRTVCITAVETEWSIFSASLPTGSRASSKKSFELGIVERLRHRLYDLKEVAKSTIAGNELVVCKRELIESIFENATKMDKLGELDKPDYKPTISAYAAGYKAGDNVKLRREMDPNKRKELEAHDDHH